MTFGDFDNDDAVDTEPPDAFQVAKRLQKYRRERDHASPDWDSLSPDEQREAIEIIVRLLAWLKRQGAIR